MRSVGKMNMTMNEKNQLMNTPTIVTKLQLTMSLYRFSSAVDNRKHAKISTNIGTALAILNDFFSSPPVTIVFIESAIQTNK